MKERHLTLAACRHGGDEHGEGCLACDGSGYVKVVVGPEGEPLECEHASVKGRIDRCAACLGSGWAGVES